MYYINNTNIVSYTCTCTCNTSLTQFVTTQFTCIVGFRFNISLYKYLTLRGLSLFLKMFPFPTPSSLLHIFWPPFTFSTPYLAPFLTWSTTSTNLLNGTRKQGSR